MPVTDDAFKIPVPADAMSTLGNNLPKRCFSIIVACDNDGGIGKENDLPWRVPEDSQFFEDMSRKTASDAKRNAVVMGRATYLSIPKKFRPLAGRWNIVCTRSASECSAAIPEDERADVTIVEGGLAEALAMIAADPKSADAIERVWCGGGEQLYTEAFGDACRPFLQTAYVTRLNLSAGCDRFFTPLKAGAGSATAALWHQRMVLADSRKSESNGVACDFQTWIQRNDEEQQYLDLVRRIMADGNVKDDRTGVGTISLFGAQMRFSLRNGRIPLLTSKRVFWRGVCEELIWFLRGDTNAKRLSDKGIKIWDGNGSREFLDSRGLVNNAEMDLGPVYGFQWRHFGAEYEASESTYHGKGVDQIKQIVHALKHNPNDRRILLSAWNPAAINQMALPPCHVMAQFYVSPAKELSCMLYQRSCDMGLGVPFNIASYSLLTLLLARASGLKLGDFVHTLGDAHVYKNHVDPLTEQLKRVPRAFPSIVVKRDRSFLEDYELDDFGIVDYFPLPTIKMEMAV